MTPKLGSCYYPEHWPEEQWQKDAEEMIALACHGLELVNLLGVELSLKRVFITLIGLIALFLFWDLLD